MDSNTGFKRLESISRGEALEIEVDGRPVRAFSGETVAVALLAAGIFTCQHHAGRPLGVFCNIGQCFGCLMTIGGVSGVRACQTPVSPGLTVETRRVETGEFRS